MRPLPVQDKHEAEVAFSSSRLSFLTHAHAQPNSQPRATFATADGVAKSAVPKSGGGGGGGKAGKAAAAAAALSPEAIEKLKQRAEKFGTVATASPILKQVLTAEQKAAEAERLAKRKAKFGIVDSPAADERKKARMEKFGTTPAGGGGKGGKGAPAAAKAAAAPARVLTEEEKAKIEARKARFN
jgi:hypothetical protein